MSRLQSHPGSSVNEGNRPRICMISTHGYVAAVPPLGAADTGGQVVYVLELSRKLAALGHDVDIWTRRFEGQDEIEEAGDGVRIIRVECGGEEFIPKEYLYEHLDEWVEGATRKIRDEGLDYAFINSHYWDAGIAGGKLSKRLGVPHVHTPHSLGIWKRREMERDFPDDREKFERVYNFTDRIERERSVMSSAELVVATTPVHIDILTDEYGIDRERVVMIPPGYDDLRFFPLGDAERSMIREELGITGRAVLALGRLAPNKGYDLLIEAFAEVASRVPEARLYLSAGGAVSNDAEEALHRELEQQAERLGVRDRVHFLPFIPDERLVDYYRGADLFVLSSRYEPFGMTTIEAMACGTPAVVTTHGGLWQELTFGVDALFADPFDPTELSIAIVQALTYDDLRERLREEAIRTVRTNYTWGHIAQQLLSEIGRRSAETDDAKNPSGADARGKTLRVVA